MKHRLHVLALPHTTLTEKDISCAYSMKILKFCRMMKARGDHVILYGPDEVMPEPDGSLPCSEHVVITTEADRLRWGFGGPGGYDTALTPFSWDNTEGYWLETNTRQIDAVRERARPGDLLLLVTSAQHSVALAFPHLINCEWAVGYEGIWSNFVAFESYAWQHHVYGLRQMRNGRAFDAVIPNFFDPDDFHLADKKEDYLLYVGRLIHRKGIIEANEISKRTGIPIIYAGPGATEWSDGRIVADGCTLEGNLTYVGRVGFADRARLMAGARAVLTPTLYIEPFGGVSVEALMCGTPVVGSDWGSFTEILTPDVGRTFRTLQQGATAVEDVQALDPAKIRRAAIKRYGLKAVGARFDAWFTQLSSLLGPDKIKRDGPGWYA